MPGIYLADVVRVEIRPGLFGPRVVLPASFLTPGNKRYSLLQRYNTETGTGKEIMICTLVGATGPGLIEVFSGATVEAMRIAGRGGGLNNPRRNQLNNWILNEFNTITTGEVVLTPVPNGVTNPGDAINFLVRQEKGPDFDVFALEF